LALSKTQIRQLAGRLVLGRIPALTLDDAHKKALADGTLGGITLFKENASNLKQLSKLTGDIIEASYHNPVLAVDQEGGAVQRFDKVLTPLPSPMALAALDYDGKHNHVTEIFTAISSRQLRKLGINMLLAPTLDLQTNAKNPIICTRSYGDDPEKTAAIGARVAAAIEAEGLIAVAKHFPGHGSSSEDSHLQLACVDKSEVDLMTSDLVPFYKLAKQLKAILIGHIWLPQLVKSQCPATLSETVIKGLLGKKLGFDGLVVSDDMIMKAITQGFGLGEACVQALLAGVDLLLVCGTIGESMEAVEAIFEATASGRVSEARLQEAAGKIDALVQAKPKYLSTENNVELSKFEQEIEHDTTISRKTSANAVAILQEDPANQSLKSLMRQKQITVIAPDHPRYPLDLATDLRLTLDDDVQIRDLRYPINPGPDDQSKIASELTDTETAKIELVENELVENELVENELVENKIDGLIIYITYRSAINDGQAALGLTILAKANLAAGIIHVASDSPYDIKYLKGFEKVVSLATFDPSCQAMSALADVLTGTVDAEGKCPLVIAAPA
jgi:beta-glucosidase-like glycosyl hydrolase